MLKVLETARTTIPLSEQNSGVYLSVVPDDSSRSKIVEIAKRIGYPLTDSEISSIHVTVIYSKHRPDLSTVNLDHEAEFYAVLTGVEWWPGHDNAGYLVLRIESPQLRALHREWLSYGCTSDYENYTIHMTLKKDVGQAPPNWQATRKLLYRDIGTTLLFTQPKLSALKS